MKSFELAFQDVMCGSTPSIYHHVSTSHCIHQLRHGLQCVSDIMLQAKQQSDTCFLKQTTQQLNPLCTATGQVCTAVTMSSTVQHDEWRPGETVRDGLSPFDLIKTTEIHKNSTELSGRDQGCRGRFFKQVNPFICF